MFIYNCVFSIASSIEEQAKTKITRLEQGFDANLSKPHVGSSIVTYAHNNQLLHFDYITQQQSADYFKDSVRDKLNNLDPRTDLEETLVSKLIRIVFNTNLPIGTSDKMQAALDASKPSPDLKIQLQSIIDDTRVLEQTIGAMPDRTMQINTKPEHNITETVCDEHLTKLQKKYETNFTEIKRQRAAWVDAKLKSLDSPLGKASMLASATTGFGVPREERALLQQYQTDLRQITTSGQLLARDLNLASDVCLATRDVTTTVKQLFNHFDLDPLKGLLKESSKADTFVALMQSSPTKEFCANNPVPQPTAQLRAMG